MHLISILNYFINLKGYFTQKWKYCHLLTRQFLQTWVSSVEQKEEDILKNVDNQAVAGSHWPPLYFSHRMEVNGYQQLFG